LSVGLGLARFYTNSPGAEKFRPASLSVANNLLSPVLRPRAMFLKRFVIMYIQFDTVADEVDVSVTMEVVKIAPNIYILKWYKFGHSVL